MTALSAYLLRWGVTSEDEGNRLVRFTADSFRSWLDDDSAELPIHADHEGPSVGRWERFEADEVGLLAHGHLDASPLGQKLARDIRDGRFTACSMHALILDTGSEARDGDPIDVLDATLVEGGPTAEPADPGAVIVSLDGHHLRDALPLDGLAFIESVTGRRITAEDVEGRHRERQQLMAEAAHDIERLALTLKRVRIAADTAWRSSRSPWRHPSDIRKMREFDAQAAELDALLRDACCNDRQLLADLRTRYRIPPAVTPMMRLQALAHTSRRAA